MRLPALFFPRFPTFPVFPDFPEFPEEVLLPDDKFNQLLELVKKAVESDTNYGNKTSDIKKAGRDFGLVITVEVEDEEGEDQASLAG